MKVTSTRTDTALWNTYRAHQLAKILGYTPWSTIPFLFLNAVYVFMDQFVRRVPVFSYIRIVPCLLAIFLLVGWYRNVPVRRLFTLHHVWIVSTLLMFYAFAIVSYRVGLFQSSVNALMICIFGMVIIGAFETRTLILLYTIPLLVFFLVIYLLGIADSQLAHIGNAVALMLVCVATNEIRERYALNEFKLSQQLADTLERLKATQAQLIQREKLASLGELTAGIAHEIRNPLNFVTNFSEIGVELTEELRQELNRDPVDITYTQSIIDDLRQNQQTILRHGKRADNIVQNMLEHSRLTPDEHQPTLLNKLADEYLRLSYKEWEIKHANFKATLITHLADNVGEVLLSPKEISRVLLNLYNNAFYAVYQRQKQLMVSGGAPDQYMPTVEISTQRTAGQVLFIVRDNGTGLSDAVRPKVFQPFFTTKPTGEGTGLGLSLSYDIVTKGHEGTLTVESTENEGSAFTMSLPAGTKDPQSGQL